MSRCDAESHISPTASFDNVVEIVRRGNPQAGKRARKAAWMSTFGSFSIFVVGSMSRLSMRMTRKPRPASRPQKGFRPGDHLCAEAPSLGEARARSSHRHRRKKISIPFALAKACRLLCRHASLRLPKSGSSPTPTPGLKLGSILPITGGQADVSSERKSLSLNARSIGWHERCGAAQARHQNPGGPSRHRYPARAFERALFEIVSDISGSVDFSLRRCVAQSVFDRAVAAGWDRVSVKPLCRARGRAIGLSRSRIVWKAT